MNIKRGLFAIIVFVTTISNTVFAGSISGSLVLPSGSYSLASDMEITVIAESTDDSPTFSRAQTIITFEQNVAGPGSSQTFSFTNLLSDHDYQLRYECRLSTTPLACEQIIYRLYYNSLEPDEMTFIRSQAQVFAGNLTSSGATLTAQRGTALNGHIGLPGGANAAADITFTIVARNKSAPFTTLLSSGVTIDFNDSTSSYTIRVPVDSGESWYIGYICKSIFDPDCGDFVDEGYFKLGATDNVVDDFYDATEFIGGVDRTGIDFRFLDGYTISGTVTSPVPVNDVNGLTIRIGARDTNNATNTFEAQATIPYMGTSGGYSITVLLDESASWLVDYNCAVPILCDDFLSRGFYDASGTVETSDQVTTELEGGESHEDIDLTLLTGPAISGTLTLSDDVAPQGGLSFIIRATSTMNNLAMFSDQIVIDEGDHEAEFRIIVGTDAAATYDLSYDCSETISTLCEKVIDVGYYDALTETTVYEEGVATAIAPAGNPLADIELIVDSQGLLPSDLCIPILTDTGSVSVICL